MGRYNKILVPFDGSASSKHALLEAVKLVDDENTRITVASVMLPYDGEMELIWVKDMREAMRKSCESIISGAKKLAGDSIKTICEEGNVHERIIDLANVEDCDVIVMGRRGLRRFERVLVGSVTARVIGHSNKDVLVVPQGTNIGWENILLAVDGSKYSDAAANKAIELAKSYQGELKIISVVDIPTEFYAESPKAAEELMDKAKGIVEDVSRQAEAANVKSSGYVREGDATEVITEVVARENADIIIMGSHGRTGLLRLLMGSVAERVIGHASCPVLIVKETNT
ncbi:universal stress protein [bacterium]|nr:universal stress protein [bacterium]MBU1754236.1 universal stress protein [bacterium]